MRPSDGHPKGCRGRRMRPRGIWVRQRGATEAYREYAARSDEADGAEYRPRCEQLRQRFASKTL